MERDYGEIQKFVVTGGAGFIGSSLVNKILHKYPDSEVYVCDKMTYVAREKNLEEANGTGRLKFFKADICEANLSKLFYNAEVVFHLAAESHVDLSFSNPEKFLMTNVVGTHRVLEACKAAQVGKLVHVSTDEVYGTRKINEPASETEVLLPSNPYSASKAAGDSLVLAAMKTSSYPIIILRPNNAFGKRQYPEKLIPKLILAADKGEKFFIHGSGDQRRNFICVEDLANAILFIADEVKQHEIFNIGVDNSHSVKEIIELVTSSMQIHPSFKITYGKDRPYNDFSYYTNLKKISSLGWKAETHIRDVIKDVITETLAYNVGVH